MEDIKKKNVFISHYNEDDEHISRLKNLLKDKGYEIRNSSIDSTKPNQASNPDYIMKLIRDRISWAGNFIVLVGPDTHTREWVDREIEEANNQGKAIIGIWIRGSQDSELPENFKKYGDALLGWTSDKIIDALNGQYNNFEKPDGTAWPNDWSIERSNC